VTSSCPGKVLIAGGYAVLERGNPGLVLSTSAHFHTTAEWGAADDTSAIAATSSTGAGARQQLPIRVISEQYQQQIELVAANGEKSLEVRREGGDKNKYVELAMGYAVAGAQCLAGMTRRGAKLDALLSEEVDTMPFSDIMKTLDLHFTFRPTAFSVGDTKSTENQNQKSLRVLSFAQLLKLSKEQTLKLWGEHYKQVLQEPEGSSHGNIRAFLKGGFECVNAPQDVITASTPAAKMLLMKRDSDLNAKPNTKLWALLSEDVEELSFAQIIDTLDQHFSFLPGAFSVGQVESSESENQKSLRVLAFAQMMQLPKEQALKLWGEHYRQVLQEPEGTSHGNIRAFLVGGFEAVRLPSGVISVKTEEASLLQLCEGRLLAECFVKAADGEQLVVTLRADNDFYSQQGPLKARGLPYTVESLRSLPKFLPCLNEQGETDVAKTGLGSSAAMVTSLVGAICIALVPELAPELQLSETALELLHGLAQLAHSIMQGKVGSGFDVCTAVYGSNAYTRYDPASFAHAMEWDSANACPPPAELIASTMTSLDHSVAPFKLPPQISLVCGDVCGGSESPSMSRKVLGWKKTAQGEDYALWDKLVSSNAQVADHLANLSKLASENSPDYNQALEECAANTLWYEQAESASPSLQCLIKLRSTFLIVRSLLQRIGELAGVPIEPKCQGELCDATMQIPGCLIAGVPGAGGYDAIFALVVTSKRSDVETFWANRGEVCALLLEESSKRPALQLSHDAPR